MDVYPLSHVSLVEAATESATTALILMMGETQSGKTKLMNLLSRSNFATGDGCGSCTQNIQISRPFEYNGRTVRIIDTPGFEHTCRTEGQILGDLATLLTDIHKAGRYIQGIVYVHSLSSDEYISNTAARAFTLLDLMCGPKAIANVIIATTSKSRHMTESQQVSREAVLCGPTSPFKDYIDKVSFFSHIKGTLGSARIILTHVLDKTRPSRALLIQEEMSAWKEFPQTTLGKALTFGMEIDGLCQSERKASTLPGRRLGLSNTGRCIHERHHCSHHPHFNHRHRHHCGHQHHHKISPPSDNDQTGGQRRRRKPTRRHLQPAVEIE